MPNKSLIRTPGADGVEWTDLSARRRIACRSGGILLQTQRMLNISLKHSENPTLHGFTVTELLVTIVVIGILSGLLLAAVQASKHKARDITCINNLRTQSVGMMSFVSSHGVYPLASSSDPKFPEHKNLWQKTMLSDDANLMVTRYPTWRFHSSVSPGEIEKS